MQNLPPLTGKVRAPRTVVGVAETFAYDGDIAAAKDCDIRYR
jgi:hypothetical protein